MSSFGYFLLLVGASSTGTQWHIPRAQPGPPPIHHNVVSQVYTSSGPDLRQATSKNRTAQPTENPSNWISFADYPTKALKDREEGRATIRLEVDKSGLVKNCVVTSSTGSASLDATTCIMLSQRAKFEPARNSRGRPVSGVYDSAVQWTLHN